MEKSVRCSCVGGDHYLHFTVFEDEPQVYIDLNATSRYGIGLRLKEAWNILRGKPACYDGIILDIDKIKEVRDYLDTLHKKFSPPH